MSSFFLPRLTVIAVLMAGAMSLCPMTVVAQTRPPAKSLPMTLRITIADTVLTARLEPGPAARDFAALLPLTLELSDYNQTEKIAQLPRKLATRGEPEGYTPRSGDIAFYAPWGNIALFYKDFAYSKGLVKLGHITGDIAVLRQPGPYMALIEQE
jgi:hypothetical protein